MKKIGPRILLILIAPVLAFLYAKFYGKDNWTDYSWTGTFFTFFLIAVPLSAIYFLLKKMWYYKIYGGLISIYILYGIRISLDAVSGAI